jgi:hypothetical protein|uniref:Uncharacterized protein n=1 Tax=Zea mays TaxID=4577 RepID=A0A804R5L4_MAIZE
MDREPTALHGRGTGRAWLEERGELLVAMGEKKGAPSRELQQWSARLLDCSLWTAEEGRCSGEGHSRLLARARARFVGEGAGNLERLRRGGTLSMGGSRQLGGMELSGHGVSAPAHAQETERRSCCAEKADQGMEKGTEHMGSRRHGRGCWPSREEQGEGWASMAGASAGGGRRLLVAAEKKNRGGSEKLPICKGERSYL